MTDIVKFYPKDAAQDPNAVLEQAIGKYQSVLIIGYDANGELDVRASLDLNSSDILWLIESFKLKLLNGSYLDVESGQ